MEEMVEQQITARDIIDPKVIRAMRVVPRDMFVPPAQRHLAFTDQPLPIGKGQTISQPYVVAFMTQALQVNRNCRVLEIGTGSGYQAAILSRIAKVVFTVEVIGSLLERAREIISLLNYEDVFYKLGNGRLGWKEEAPFDRIIVTAASADIPPSLRDQLADKGRMIIPLGKSEWNQNLVVLTKHGRKFSQENILPVRFVPLVKNSHGK
jgi:protein-L-isoaspartate(D-aspartate) O-methyltransferase